jgi:lipopolysaccharide heptosyltransferase II
MKILFVNPFGIGDILFTTALFKPLKEKGYSIYYWCNERVVDILRYNKAIDGIFDLSRGDLKRIFKTSIGEAIKRIIGLIKKIKKERFDIALDFSLDSRYSLLLRLLGVKRIAGFDYKGRGRFLTDNVKIDGFDDRYMVEQYAMLLKVIDKAFETHNGMELSIGDSARKWANEILKQNGIGTADVLIGIAPGGGASWGESAFRKHWPKERFAYVAEELLSRDKYKIILFGSEKEVDICNFIADRMKDSLMNLCGKTTLGQFAALLERCKLLMTNDGGPLHMASALGVKTVSIFGPVDEKVYGPYPPSDNHIVITSEVGCRPCYKKFKYPLCHNRACLNSIEPSRIIEAVRSNLKDKEKVEL